MPDNLESKARLTPEILEAFLRHCSEAPLTHHPVMEFVSQQEYEDRKAAGHTGPGPWTGVDWDKYVRIKGGPR